MPSTIQGWTPKTCHLLANPTNGGGYDIIDHAFGSSFPSDLMAELQTCGWMDRLCKARTKMDVNLDKIMQLSLGDVAINNGKSVRGDESVFIPRKLRSSASFSLLHPLLRQLVSSIENTAIESLSAQFDFDTDLTSVQLAQYPGDGTSGYPRHCDSGAKCKNETDSETIDSNGRILTFVYYLTPNDWDSVLDGGALRIYLSSRANTTDVIPFADRIVVFRSDHVEHQVLPSLRRERVAITVWLYGRTKVSNHHPKLPQSVSLDHGLSFDVTNNLPPPLPIPELTTDANEEQETIFVAIPSYRDSETWPTIQSLLQTAYRPNRVHIGAVWQVDTLCPEEVRSFTGGGDCLLNIKQLNGTQWDVQRNFRSLTMDYRQATGESFTSGLLHYLFTY